MLEHIACKPNPIASSACGACNLSRWPTEPSQGTIGTYFPGGQFLGGIFWGADPASYPTGNYFPGSMSEVGFVNLAGRDYRLSAASQYKSAASDGTDIGANIDAVNAAGTCY
jgi:hypothetical protein